MKLNFFTESAVFLKLKLTLAFCVHIYFISFGNKVLVFTHRTDHRNKFAGAFFGHVGIITQMFMVDNQYLAIYNRYTYDQ